MDLFDYAAEQKSHQNMPLAARMRPQTLDDYMGQEKIVGKGRLLRRAIEADQLTSVIFHGPPGTGKTTLAKIIAASTKSLFLSISAVTSGIAEMRETIKQAREELKLYNRRTLLFVDEIHRFNKTQQDALLPAVEDGTVILIGATTENPYFEVNSALLSRSRVFRLESLKPEQIISLLKRAVEKDVILQNLNLQVDEAAYKHWANLCAGDARSAYNALELAALTTEQEADGQRKITEEIAEESIQRRVVAYDKKGDWHYDVISAFIKSMRGSDPDATLHWLARMIEAGEAPEFIARRIVICAAEDIGLADPQALVVAMAAADAVHFVGWPEAQIILAQAALHLACAPKSNSTVMGIANARQDLHGRPFAGVPPHLCDGNSSSAETAGKGYKYPHAHPDGFIKQQYLPEDMQDASYYQPTNHGWEGRAKERLQRLHPDKFK